ncbi:MAG TPA: ABC transporter ATP-binding protein [Vicinamibacterales bacterium]|nr:ABC transporter ATP-binding protein [Vicinamibacterales bacterium]
MSPFRRLIRYIARYRRAFTLGLVCSVTTTAITLASPLVLQYAIDDLTREVTRQRLLLYAGELLAIGLAGGVFRFWTRRILIGASRDLEYDMRNDFFAHLQTLPLSYYQSNRTGDLMSRATNDLNAVRMMIGPSIMYSANTVLTFVAALGMMLAIDVRLTLLSLIPLPFVSISVNYFGNAIHKGFEQIQAQLSEVSAVAQEALAGVRVVRAYRQEAAETDRFRAANLEYLRRNRRLIALQGFFFPTMSFFLGLGSMLVLWLGSREVITQRITLGEFVAFFAYLTMLSWPMIAFGWVTNMLQRGMASWKRMLEVLDTPPAIRDVEEVRLKPDPTIAGPTDPTIAGPTDPTIAGPTDPTIAGPTDPTAVTVRGEIEFRNLTFAFGDTTILRDISVRIPAGQTTAIVGVTGAGKSTLIGLIARLHEPPPGTVLVDGRDVRDWPLATLRGSIGFVPQEPFLFSDTIGDNVAFGLDARHFAATGYAPQPDATTPDDAWHRDRQARIEQAAAIARLDKDLSDFPRGYATLVGERGITLSGGQKQRTALARATATDPRILILDDSLSAVDTYTEEEILSRLRGVMRERTSIIVSHRISTVRDADQILVLDDGQIVERGSHDELLAHHGLYAELHEKQLLEEELAAS